MSADSHATAAPDPHAATSEAEPKKKRRPEKVDQFFNFLEKVFRETLPDLFGSFRSVDRSTRRMALLTVMCGAGFLWVSTSVSWHFGGVLLKKYLDFKEAQVQEIKARLAVEKEKTDQAASWVSLKFFTFEAVPSRSEFGKYPPRSVEFDLSVRCDSPLSCQYLSHYSAEAKNAIVRVLAGQKREFLMTPLGKKKLRQAITESLNAWIPHGKIVDVFFTRFLIL
ncbi:MAG: flagellar basal body-associated FliL family protein [Bdellovibrionia bacterium]